MYSLDLYFLGSVIVIVIVIYLIFKWIQINRSTQPLDIECVTIFNNVPLFTGTSQKYNKRDD